jgi:cell division septation protein DedD
MNKSYEFSFERGQLIKFVGGLMSLVLLMFFAGFLVGVGVPLNEAPAVFVVQGPQPPYRPELPLTAGVLPVEPVVEEVAELAEEDLPALDPADDAYGEQAIEEEPQAAAIVEEVRPPVIPGQFAVQLGAFLSRRNADALARRLTVVGYEVDVVVREDSHGRPWYLVRYGLFPNRAEASAVAVDLKNREKFDALVRPSGSM